MPSRLHLSTILLAAAILWGAALVVEGVAVSGAWFHPFSGVVGALVLLLAIFDIWAWRLRILQGWFVPRPDIRGTWQVELRSDWKDPRTGERLGPVTVYLAVRQTFSTLSIRMMSAESTSALVASEIKKDVDGTYRVAGIYHNEPKLSVRERSSLHYGAFLLSVQGDPAKDLAGHYWTDRSTQGELQSLARHATISLSFGEAAMLFSAARATPAA
jgi:hypothetical protein